MPAGVGVWNKTSGEDGEKDLWDPQDTGAGEQGRLMELREEVVRRGRCVGSTADVDRGREVRSSARMRPGFGLREGEVRVFNSLPVSCSAHLVCSENACGCWRLG